ncbi:MAG: PAS domain S-box protein, partial [Deltaproteobacteria bacterium]|nr:PAS domain S-box protein [Deltaproteobacteria bacterium]
MKEARMAIEPDRSDLESERVQLLLRQTPLALVGSLVILLAMFYVLWPLVPRWSLLIWGGAGFGLIGARIALWWPLRREGPAPRNARRIRRAFTGLTLGMGLQWSVVPIFFFPEQSFPHQVFISFMAGGLTAGAIASYSAVFWQAPSIFLPILIPLTTRLFLTESEFAPILGSLALLFTVISLALTRNVYTTTKRALSLSLEKNELVRTLEVARRQAEALNEGLRKEIEEREHQEQARISAEAREERLQAMAEAAPVPLCLVRRKDGIVLYANEPFRVLFGWNQGLEESRHIHPLFADSSGWRRVCDAVDTQGSLSNHLQALQTTGGSSIQAVISCRPLLIGGESAVMCGVVDTSPLARAEENLRTSEERFRTLAESSLQGLMIHRDGKALFVNTTFARMFGYADPAEIMAMEDVNQLVHAEDRMRMVEYAASRMRGEDPPAAYEVRGVKKDGTLILLEAQARLVPWVKGPAIQLVNRDITESRRAQEALHQNRRLLQTVLDTVPQWMFVKDMQARYVMVNRSMAEFFGKSPEDFVHRSFMQITEHKDMDDVNLSDQADAQVLTTNSVVTVPDMRVYTREGALRIRHVIKFPLRNDQGQVAGIVGISEDITERLKAEKELRASEQRYRDLIEGSLQGIIIHRGFKPLFVNKAFAEIFGFASPRELLAVENLESYIDSADRTKLRQISATPGAEADRTGQLVELNVKRKDGTPMRLQSFTTEILWEGTPAILAALIDITERSRLE